jgi:hypothetical protein
LARANENPEEHEWKENLDASKSCANHMLELAKFLKHFEEEEKLQRSILDQWETQKS